MSESTSTAYRQALRVMDLNGPEDIHALASAVGRLGDLATNTVLGDYLSTAEPNDPLRKDLHLRIATWDAAEAPEWGSDTEPNTTARRAQIVKLLGLDMNTASIFSMKFPVVDDDTIVIGSANWQPWYDAAIRSERNFYWDHYQQLLLRKPGMGPDAVADLDAATTDVVERLTNPTQSERRQAKGLVVGYVQSGKTANFTGVIAKAIDAGYRLVIVLTGTTDLLRTQTQRRLDMELVGSENLLRGITDDDTESFDYHDDPDWHGGLFVRHGVVPSSADRPEIDRLTTRDFDYRSLKQGISALDFKRRDKSKPLYDPVNLLGLDARLLVVKKNGPILRKLVKDLSKITARLADIPALIIDDEADLASPNTSNPKTWKEDQKERTAINAVIGELLTSLPRAQYVGYTATPFANVFIDPSDSADIFPSDFLISLRRPVGYMGANDFQDADSLTRTAATKPTIETSNEERHVRKIPESLSDEAAAETLLEAMDMFVLTGAIKLYRRSQNVGEFKHHTMLVHEVMHTDSQAERATMLRKLWREAGYHSMTGTNRLRDLYDRVRAVTAVVDDHLPMPTSFDELSKYIAQSVREIGKTGDPVLVVNSADLNAEDVDFDKRAVWRILVGGNKLARGFTVEGLTISYYRRMTKLHDSLMQMGRWFGFRPHYRDLVRLYTTPTLHQAYAAACQSEEHFRNQLRRYAKPVDGRPQITPAQIPPLVAQYVRWLKPAAANKMYNAILAVRRSPGVPIEPRSIPFGKSGPGRSAMEQSTSAFAPLIAAASQKVWLRGAKGKYDAFVGLASHASLLTALKALSPITLKDIGPDLRWLGSLTNHDVSQWLVILPQQSASGTFRTVMGRRLSVSVRLLLRINYFSAISDPSHRETSDIVHSDRRDIGDAVANQLAIDKKTGVIFIYPMVGRPEESRGDFVIEGHDGDILEPNQIAIGFRIVAPPSESTDDEDLVTFTTIDKSRPYLPIIDADEATPIPT